jgi:hypothetical protein
MDWATVIEALLVSNFNFTSLKMADPVLTGILKLWRKTTCKFLRGDL